MPKYTVRVVESVTAYYHKVTIEAGNEEEAEKIAEEMRVQGDLGLPREDVDDVDYDIQPVEE